MPHSIRLSLFVLAGTISLSLSGCNMVPGHWLHSQARQSRNLWNEKNTLAQQSAQAQSSLHSVSQERDRFARENQDLKQRLNVAQDRIGNLAQERENLENQTSNLLDKLRNMQNPLSDAATKRFEKLDEQYPGFKFDPETGVSKFSSDILFDSGSAKIKSGADPLLTDFANILNEGEARRLSIMIAGHTDDRPIGKPSTRKNHPTNWHLSAHRAIEVLSRLQKKGLKPSRMQASGYGEYQPLVPNTSEASRRQNRRVEIYVLAPEVAIAGWDPSEAGEIIR